MAKIIDDETIENVCILAKLSLHEEARKKQKKTCRRCWIMWKKLDELDTNGLNRCLISLVIRMFSVKMW